MSLPAVGRYLFEDDAVQRTFAIQWHQQDDSYQFTGRLLGEETHTTALQQNADDGTWFVVCPNGEGVNFQIKYCGLLLRYPTGKTLHAKLLDMTPELRSIIDHVVGKGETMLIDAAPGSGKSTALREWCRANSSLRILLLAFNTSVCSQLARNFAELENVTVKTIHSVAYEHTKKFHNEKVGEPTLTDLKRELNQVDDTGDWDWDSIKRAKQSLDAFCASADESPGDDLEGLWNIFQLGRLNGRIKMPHNVYLKLFQLGVASDLRLDAFRDYDALVLDEAQDCTDCMLSVFENRYKVKVFACDPRQNIYQFNGVSGRYLQFMRVDHRKQLPQTFRFGQKVADFVTRIGGNSLQVHGSPQHSTGLRFDVDPVDAYKECIAKGEKVTVLAWKNRTLFLEAMRIVTSVNAIAERHVKSIAIVGSYQKFRDSFVNPLMDLFYLLRNQSKKIKSNYVKKFPNLERFRHHCKEKEDVEWLSKLSLLDTMRAQPQAPEKIIEQIEEILCEEAHKADVLFSTVHQAKGLGFPNVLLLDDFLGADKERHLNENSDDEGEDSDDEGENSDDEGVSVEQRNLLYVGASRVSSGTLFVSGGTSARCRFHGFIPPVLGDSEANIQLVNHDEPATVAEAEAVEQLESHQNVDDPAPSESGSGGDSDVNEFDAKSVQTAPATVSNEGCLLPETFVWTKEGPKDAKALALTWKYGDELYSGQADRPTVIRHVRCLPRRDRDVINITITKKGSPYHEQQLSLTSSHALMVRASSEGKFRHLLAKDVLQTHLLRSKSTCEVQVVEVTRHTQETEVVQVFFTDTRSTMYVSGAPASSDFMEVFGETAPPNCVAKILSFARSDGFYDLFIKSEELREVRDMLASHNVSMDLAEHGIGAGKLVISNPEIAHQAIAFLKLHHPILNAGQVVVDEVMEDVVRTLVSRAPAPRRNYVKREQDLDMSRSMPPKRKRDRDPSMDTMRATRPKSEVTCSTTDWRIGRSKNPRGRI